MRSIDLTREWQLRLTGWTIWALGGLLQGLGEKLSDGASYALAIGCALAGVWFVSLGRRLRKGQSLAGVEERRTSVVIVVLALLLTVPVMLGAFCMVRDAVLDPEATIARWSTILLFAGGGAAGTVVLLTELLLRFQTRRFQSRADA